MSGFQGKFRRRKTNFAAVSNNALQDSSLSLRAKGLYAMIQSYINIPSYDLYKGYLMKICLEGERAFNAAWKELKEHGYLKLYRMPGKQCGRFVYEYELLDTADRSSSSTINLNSQGKPIKPAKPKKHDLNKGDSEPPQKALEDRSDHPLQNVPYGQSVPETPKNEPDHTLHFAPYAPCTPCSEHPVLNVGSKNKSDFNKNDNKKNKGNGQSVYQEETGEPSVTDGQTDEIREALKEQIDYSYFEDNLPEELPGVNALLDCMVEMLVNPSTSINRVPQSRHALKRYIEKADTDIVKGFLEHMRERGMKPKNIRNISAYWKSAFINFLREDSLVLETAN